MSSIRPPRVGAALRGLWLPVSACALTLLAGCSPGGASGPSTALLGALGLTSAVLPSQLLQRMVDAPRRVAFEATRRYEAAWEVDGVRTALIYRERVVSDGQGGFSIDPLDLLEPDMVPAERDLFLLLQKTREGFFFKHRDFGVRDLELFLAGWQVTERGQTSLLGRGCTLLDVRRRKDPDRTYHLTVDGENGLILRAEERDRQGRLVSLLECESLDLAPAPEPAALHRDITTETVVASDAELRAVLSFRPVQPRLVPTGYELLETAAVVDPITGEEWARYTYGDGVEELFFLHGGRAATPGSSAAADQQQAIRFLYVGPWTILFGELDQGSYVAMGKVSRESLQDLVESAFF